MTWFLTQHMINFLKCSMCTWKDCIQAVVGCRVQYISTSSSFFIVFFISFNILTKFLSVMYRSNNVKTLIKLEFSYLPDSLTILSLWNTFIWSNVSCPKIHLTISIATPPFYRLVFACYTILLLLTFLSLYI